MSKFWNDNRTNKMSASERQQLDRIIDTTVREKIADGMADYEDSFCAQWLLTIAKHNSTMGKKALERLYKEFYDIRKDNETFYEDKAHKGVVECGARNELKNTYGVDIEELHNKYYSRLVAIEFSKGIGESKRGLKNET